MATFFRADDLIPRKFDNSSLHVYSRVDQPQSDSLVVLIHGLGGTGYGTWRDIPRLLLQSEALNADVATFDYVSGQRKRFLNSPHLESIVEQLVEELLDLTHQSIFLVGHSMGGVIAMGAVRETHSRLASSQSSLDRYRAVFTLASPLAGSKWMPFKAPIREGEGISILSDYQHANSRFFADHVGTDLHPPTARHLWIPHFSAKASGDRFVGRFSSSLTVPSERSRTFPGGHSSFLKGRAVATWLVDKSNETQLNWNRMKQWNQPAPVFRTQFEGHPSHGEWMDSYHDALSQFGIEEDVRVLDLSGQEVAEPIELKVRVLRSEAPDTPTDVSVIEPDLDLHDRGALRALGVSAFGDSPDADAAAVAAAIGGRSNSWAAGSRSLPELRSDISSWLSRVNRLGPLIATRPGAAAPPESWSKAASSRKDLEDLDA